MIYQLKTESISNQSEEQKVPEESKDEYFTNQYQQLQGNRGNNSFINNAFGGLRGFDKESCAASSVGPQSIDVSTYTTKK